MVRWLWVVVVLIVVGLLLLSQSERDREVLPLLQEPSQEARPAGALRPRAAPELAPASGERVEVAASAEPEPARPAEGTGDASVPERADLSARDWLEIRVVDPEERPVFDAELSIRGVRKKRDSGSWYSMRDGPAVARSDTRGRARIPYVRWVDIDERTGSVDLTVTHAEFVPFRDSSFPIGAGQQPVVLRRGAALTVTGWYGSPDAVKGDITIQVDRKASLPPDAWTRGADGRLTTLRLSPGDHLIRIAHESPEHGLLASAIESFSLAENEWKDLHLELFARTTLRGRLDDTVPRPVLDGHVMVNLHQDSPDGPSMDQDHEATVREDGSFELHDLPPGGGQIFAWCGGWVSKRTRVDSPEQAGIHFGRPPTPEEVQQAMERVGDQAFEAQRISLPASEPITVQMGPTGVLEVSVRTEDGSPLAGAVVVAHPNVHWIGVGSSLVPWGEWKGTTDAMGRARIEGLPQEEDLLFQAFHDGHQMCGTDRRRIPRADIVSAQTTSRELVLEPIGD